MRQAESFPYGSRVEGFEDQFFQWLERTFVHKQKQHQCLYSIYLSATLCLSRTILFGQTGVSMIAVSCRWGWTRQNCCNVQHQRAIWKSSTAASEKAGLVARKTGRARRASLDLHRQNRERKAKHLTGERRETCAGAEDHAGKNVQGRSLRSRALVTV